MATQQSCNSARCSATIAECRARVRPLNPASVKYVPRRFSQHRNSSALQNRRAKRRRCHSRNRHHNHPARNAGAANASKADARIAAKSELNAVSVADVESKRPREARQMTERYHAE